MVVGAGAERGMGQGKRELALYGCDKGRRFGYDHTRKVIVEINSDTSDGLHTFNELYDHRRVLTAALFNEWVIARPEFAVQKSWHHSDGQLCFGGGWFIVVAELPAGQISYHYEEIYWDLFKIPEYTTPHEYDGHTAQDVVTRLTALASS